MSVLELLRGRSTVEEVMEMPNRAFHTLYRRFYLHTEKESEKEKTENKIAGEELEDAMAGEL